MSLTGDTPSEWWTVRESQDYYYPSNDSATQKKSDEGYYHSDKKYDSEKSYIHTNECSSSDSWSWKTIDPNILGKTTGRISDFNISRLPINKSRFSSDTEYCKNESKSSYNTNKSFISVGSSNISFKVNKLKCKKDLCSIEEELYVKGSTAVWSKGLLSSKSSNRGGTSRITLCSYTMENPIKHALWCTFYLVRPSFITMQDDIHDKLDEPVGKALPCICLIDSCNMRVFTANNEDFITSLPFQVSSVWSTKFGILIEKETSSSVNQSFNKLSSNVTDYDSSATNIYSLAHPLDELCPVALKHGAFQLINNPSYKIIYTCCDPSICFVYDASTGLHYVYRIRKIRMDEWIEMSVSKIKLCSTIPSPASSKVRRKLVI